eukprot:694413-Pleurochrysis_carterae.AAC.1
MGSAHDGGCRSSRGMLVNARVLAYQSHFNPNLPIAVPIALAIPVPNSSGCDAFARPPLFCVQRFAI